MIFPIRELNSFRPEMGLGVFSFSAPSSSFIREYSRRTNSLEPIMPESEKYRVRYRNRFIRVMRDRRFLLAVKLFELRRLSLGKAAELCGMKKSNFMDEMGRMGIPVINLDNDQIRDELKNA